MLSNQFLDLAFAISFYINQIAYDSSRELRVAIRDAYMHETVTLRVG